MRQKQQQHQLLADAASQEKIQIADNECPDCGSTLSIFYDEWDSSQYQCENCECEVSVAEIGAEWDSHEEHGAQDVDDPSHTDNNIKKEIIGLSYRSFF